MTSGKRPPPLPTSLKPLLLVLALATLSDQCRADPTPTDPTPTELDAIAHTLGFVDGVPHVGDVRVAILFDPADAGAAVAAQTTAAALGKTDGPGSANLAATAVPAGAVGTAGTFDAFLLMPGTGHLAGPIVAEAARRHLVTISSDPQCLVDRTCVLWVAAEPRVAITLDTKLAETIGVRISPIFAMMVKRR
ncbi:MAG TPA: hypothetical protein VL899_03910 [Alphaproteobacteria bacterium]|jgi:hypothetical protein|nr:hypothetical protein [Alphaproteobacteria bacterium]